jgi:hypothetical protein
MVVHAELMKRLPAWGAVDVTDLPDKPNSVSSVVIRCSYQGRRTVAVGSDATTEECIGAVLDLLDMHLHAGAAFAGSPVAGDEVTVVVGERANTEALDAIGSLVAELRSGPSVRVLVATDAGSPREAPLAAADFSTSSKAHHYLQLMQALRAGPHSLLQTIQRSIGREELRAYPMLTGKGWWSLRLEGLEVGRFRSGKGWLDVGKVGKTGNTGKARTAWLNAVGDVTLKNVTEEGGSIAAAVTGLSAFADAWLTEPDPAPKPQRQNEHALESRVLRGACPVRVRSGPLQLLQPDPVTNWGSQFPTRWGHTSGNGARYLDALMRDGRVPWAVEMKVRGSGGVGRYYRHAVGQAVLYRHFIRSAAPLDEWFAEHQLDRAACRAAVVVPDLDKQPKWRDRLAAVCALVDVDLVEVPHEYASAYSGIHDGPCLRSAGACL